jgi:hypothetical protein
MKQPLPKHFIHTLLVTVRQIMPAPIGMFSEPECDQSQKLPLAFGE